MSARCVRNLTMLSLAAVLGAAVLPASAGPSGNVPFPADFRTWTHAKSVVAFAKDDPFHGYRNVYVNAAGAKAMTGGGAYAEGSVLVMSFHAPVKDGDTYTQGKPIKYVIMRKDGARAKATGGWAYEAYPAASMKPLVGDKTAEKCHDCHAAGAADNDFVFSRYAK